MLAPNKHVNGLVYSYKSSTDHFNLEQATQGSDHGTKPPRVREQFGQCSQLCGLIFGWSFVESRVTFYDPCGALSTWDTLQFLDSKWNMRRSTSSS